MVYVAPTGTIGEQLRDFRRDLRKAGAGWPKQLNRINRKVADFVASEAQGRTETAQQAKAARAIQGKGTVRQAAIRISSAPPFAAGAFFGAKQYKQFPEWVGNTWEVGGSGGPYALNPAIRDNKEKIADMYADEFMRLASVVSKAFPDGITGVADAGFIYGDVSTRRVYMSGTGAF